MTEPLEGIEQINADLVLWRVFGIRDVFEDRPHPEWSVDEAKGPGNEDQLHIAIGDLPADLIQALQQWRAQIPGLLDTYLGHQVTAQERLARYEQNHASVQLPEFDEPYPLWFTLRLSRPVPVMATVGTAIDWLEGDADTMRLIHKPAG